MCRWVGSSAHFEESWCLQAQGQAAQELALILGPPEPEDAGTTVLGNVDNHSTNVRASHLTRCESSATLLSEPQISKCHYMQTNRFTNKEACRDIQSQCAEIMKISKPSKSTSGHTVWTKVSKMNLTSHY